MSYAVIIEYDRDEYREENGPDNTQCTVVEREVVP